MNFQGVVPGTLGVSVLKNYPIAVLKNHSCLPPLTSGVTALRATFLGRDPLRHETGLPHAGQDTFTSRSLCKTVFPWGTGFQTSSLRAGGTLTCDDRSVRAGAAAQILVLREAEAPGAVFTEGPRDVLDGPHFLEEVLGQWALQVLGLQGGQRTQGALHVHHVGGEEPVLPLSCDLGEQKSQGETNRPGHPSLFPNGNRRTHRLWKTRLNPEAKG